MNFCRYGKHMVMMDDPFDLLRPTTVTVRVSAKLTLALTRTVTVVGRSKSNGSSIITMCLPYLSLIHI